MTDETLRRAERFIHMFILPAIIVFGIIGNLFNIYIFTRPSLYRSCSIYFLAGTFNGLALLLFGTTSRWLAFSFDGLDGTQRSLFFCRFRHYLINIIYNLAPYFIACVTVDRFCSSSANVTIRRLSSRPHVAYKVIGGIVVITSIAFSHVLVFFTIEDMKCQTRPGFYTSFFPFFATLYYFTALVIIILFGLGTIYNIRVQSRRMQPMTKQVDRKRQRSDGQLLVMLFVHVSTYACFALPYHGTLIAASVYPAFTYDSLFIFIQRMTIIALNLSQAVSVALSQGPVTRIRT